LWGAVSPLMHQHFSVCVNVRVVLQPSN
jgi:hypothetical protein